MAPHQVIDLRSDTVTQPSPGMRRALAEAVVGEDLHHEDATVNLLESRAATLLGQQAALFVPTGTMGNLIALKIHTQPSEEVILEAQSHIYNCELAGLSAFCGLLARPLPGDGGGMLRWNDIHRAIRPRFYTRSQTRLVCLENTHNYCGGSVLPHEEVVDLCRRARETGLQVHLDGARLANAAVASRRSMADLATGFDSVMLDFAKGLGSPAGAVVAGSAAAIERARSIRKMLGGAIHQAGILAAACLWGLDHLLPRLGEDHRLAKRLAEALAELPGVCLDPHPVRTNIVIATLAPDWDPAASCGALRDRGVLVNPLEDGRLRFVTHCDVTAAGIDKAIAALTEVFRGKSSPGK
jgi:threonine aldolase